MFRKDELGYMESPKKIGNIVILLVILASIILGGCVVAKKIAIRTSQETVYETTRLDPTGDA